MKKNNRKQYGYQTTNRAKHNLKIHMIFMCKYKKKLLYTNLDNFLKMIICGIKQKSDFEIIEIETDKDHIHLMILYLLLNSRIRFTDGVSISEADVTHIPAINSDGLRNKC